jgi:hypothetical protein
MNLVVEENKVSGKVVYAKSYEPILEALNQKEAKVSSNKDTILSLATMFNSFASSGNNHGPKIRTYDTKHEFDSLLEDILAKTDSTKEILLFTNQLTEQGFFGKKSHDEFIRKRIENHIKIKVLAVNNAEGLELQKSDSKSLRETKLLPDSFDFNSEIYIYDGKITMIDVKEDIIGVVIESEELFKIHTQIFNILFNI